MINLLMVPDGEIEERVLSKLLIKYGGLLIVALGVGLVVKWPRQSRALSICMLLIGFVLVNIPNLGFDRRLPVELERALFLSGLLLAVVALIALGLDANRRKREKDTAPTAKK